MADLLVTERRDALRGLPGSKGPSGTPGGWLLVRGGDGAELGVSLGGAAVELFLFRDGYLRRPLWDGERSFEGSGAYESIDCGGTPFVAPGWWQHAFQDRGGGWWWVPPGTPARRVTLQSGWLAEVATCERYEPLEYEVLEAVRLDVVPPELRPPFAVEKRSVQP